MGITKNDIEKVADNIKIIKEIMEGLGNNIDKVTALLNPSFSEKLDNVKFDDPSAKEEIKKIYENTTKCIENMLDAEKKMGSIIENNSSDINNYGQTCKDLKDLKEKFNLLKNAANNNGMWEDGNMLERMEGSIRDTLEALTEPTDKNMYLANLMLYQANFALLYCSAHLIQQATEGKIGTENLNMLFIGRHNEDSLKNFHELLGNIAVLSENKDNYSLSDLLQGLIIEPIKNLFKSKEQIEKEKKTAQEKFLPSLELFPKKEKTEKTEKTEKETNSIPTRGMKK